MLGEFEKLKHHRVDRKRSKKSHRPKEKVLLIFDGEELMLTKIRHSGRIDVIAICVF